MRIFAATVIVGCLITAGCGGGAGDSEVAEPNPPATSPNAAVPSGTPSQSARSRSLPALLKFEAATLDGKPFTGANLAERPVVFWFWAPWCPKCAAEGPSVAKVARKYGDQVAFVGIAGLDKSKDQMRQFVRRTGTAGISHLDDRDGTLYAHFKITEQSMYVFMRRNGQTTRDTGPLSEADLTTHVEELAGSA